MKISRFAYWPAVVLLLASAGCWVGSNAYPVTCRFQTTGPEVCTSAGTGWGWAADAMLALGVLVAVAVFLARRRSRRVAP